MFSLAAHRSFLVCSGLRAFQLGRCADRVPLERPIVSQFDDVYCRAYPAKGIDRCEADQSVPDLRSASGQMLGLLPRAFSLQND
jgi:hypothetical protein